jgi:hypothetical protein
MEAGELQKLKQQWNDLVSELEKKFGDKPDLQVILFLIGVQEVGKGYAKYSKDEKQNLMHIATCKLLTQYGYYEFEKKDEEGWPHYKAIKALPAMTLGEQDVLLKKAVLDYFAEGGLMDNPVI